MPVPKAKTYTLKHIYALPDGEHAELIDGQIFNMAPPGTQHQILVGEFYATIRNFIKTHGGNCRLFVSPFAVFLNEDNQNYLEPDVSVICSPEKIDDKGCHGAPDWVIEVVSPGTQAKDYGIKLFKYRTAGVREYWIVNPLNKTATIYDLENDTATAQYSFDENIPVTIFPELKIKISDLL